MCLYETQTETEYRKPTMGTSCPKTHLKPWHPSKNYNTAKYTDSGKYCVTTLHHHVYTVADIMAHRGKITRTTKYGAGS